MRRRREESVEALSRRSDVSPAFYSENEQQKGCEKEEESCLPSRSMWKVVEGAVDEGV